MADLPALWVAIGLALFCADLLFTPWREFEGLWRYVRSGLPLHEAALRLATAVFIVAVWWSALWPLHVAALLGKVRR